ncbi:MAG TPA: adenylate/guanylate cyclase domain-containing protein [Longimicrobiaceae bacterium]|nr:adenylate/guanylate cyclase domain-containing protein [Longimicrobiaceae bacterium]
MFVVDINDSTQMKERSSEASWIPTYGWFFDLVSQVIQEEGGTVVKYLGDGVLAVFGEDDAARAINSAIKIQEHISDDNESRRINLTCSIGIAYGEVAEFSTLETGSDYLGQTVDRAFRLCSAANAKAIFIDSETVSAAAMNRVQSRVGLALKRRVADYQGPTEKIAIKGFAAPVHYHEIWWAVDRYGVSTGFVTNETGTQAPSIAGSQRPAPPARGPELEWLHGYVKRWGQNAEFGFITTGEEDFYFNVSYLFHSAPSLEEGKRVVFAPLDALDKGKSRRAQKIFVLGEQVTGRVSRVLPRGFGFADVTGQHGDVHSLFILIGDGTPVKPGDMIGCEISENPHGPIGVNVRPSTAT